MCSGGQALDRLMMSVVGTGGNVVVNVHSFCHPSLDVRGVL